MQYYRTFPARGMHSFGVLETERDAGSSLAAASRRVSARTAGLLRSAAAIAMCLLGQAVTGCAAADSMSVVEHAPLQGVAIESRLQKPGPVAPATGVEGENPTGLEEAIFEQAADDYDQGFAELAARKLLGWLCPAANWPAQPTVLGQCAAPSSPAAASGWVLLGDLAFQSGERASLPIAEAAYGKAMVIPASRYPQSIVAYKRAWTRFRSARYGPALEDFLVTLKLAPDDAALAPEALQYAAGCIAEPDWDEDDKPDAVRGFSRPAVKALLPADAIWLADLMVRVVSSMAEDASPDARVTLKVLEARFPGDPRIEPLRRRVEDIR